LLFDALFNERVSARSQTDVNLRILLPLSPKFEVRKRERVSILGGENVCELWTGITWKVEEAIVKEQISKE